MTHSLVVDSSAWIEMFSQGPLAKPCEREQRRTKEILVPTLVLYEVYKKICSTLSEDRALSAVAVMSQHKIDDLTRDVALTAADLSLEHKLPMADSIVLAHARLAGARLLTLDNDFAGIDEVVLLR
ncbi:MAG TPA: type II toxin-antitoxin system VapC family toxin [Bdellovibrionota bacterium]|nr:type II toxin-antitoxin system VapC family toxin [Bdellovibrionota bacterium]